MKRLLIAALLLAACSAGAQNVSEFSTDVLALSASARPLSVYAEYDVSVKVTARRGSNPVRLTNAVVRWTISDRRNGNIWREVDGVVLDGTGGVALATVKLDGLEPGAYYEGALTAYDPVTTAKITDLSLNHINLTNWCDGCVSGGGGGGTTVITQQLSIAIGGSTTLVEATFSPINNFTNQLIISIGGVTSTVFVGDTIVNNTNIVNMVNNIGGVQVFTSNTVSFGYVDGTNAPAFVRLYGGGILATGVLDGANLNLYLQGGASTGFPLTVFDYTGSVVLPSPTSVQFGAEFSVTALGNGLFVTRTDLGGFPTNFSGTNISIYAPNWSVLSPSNQYHIFSGTTTQALIKLYGGAGGYGSGAYTEISVAHPSALKLATMEMLIGQGGYWFSNTTAGVLTQRSGGFPNGGNAFARSNVVASTGGGRTQVSILGSILGIAAGGGYYTVAPGYGNGGASVGGGAWGVNNGGPATATNGGPRATTVHATYVWTNTDGGYLYAGDAGWATNVTSGAIASHGSGDGFFGSGGGIATGGSGGLGAGGSSFINTTNPVFVSGTSQRSASQTYPPNVEEPNYIAGRAGSVASSPGIFNGHGMVIVYER